MVDMNAADPPVGAEDLCLHRLIEEQARRMPDREALVFETQRLSYGELCRRADRLAHCLAALGVGPEMPVGLFVERSLETVVGILGILKAGGAYLPIDPDYPRERVAFMLADAGVSVLLTQSGLLARLPNGVAQRICLDSFDWSEETESAGAPNSAVGPENLAYVIYTSGSTGHPKGVCIEHRNIVSYVLGVSKRLRFAPGMRHATVSTIAADLGNTVVFPALATGGCLHVIARERSGNQALLAEYFKRERIDVLKIVPSHLAALQSGEHPESIMPKCRLILGGESARLDWIGRLRDMAPECEIHNHYGPTETTVGVLTYRVGLDLPATRSGALPLGKPLPRNHVRLLDEHGQPVPAGQVGELFIGGAGVARGYLNRPELTHEKFVADPTESIPGERFYRSGDLARCLPDGNIEFCGRIDHQVKIHGYRVELGEIEKTIRAHGGVREAVVFAHEDSFGDRQLQACVVPKRAHQPLWAQHAVHLLPDGMPVAHLNRNETDYIYREIFVLQAYLRHGIVIGDGDCIVDAGANIGLFTVFASRLARDLRIVSFEPNPAAYACLQANADAWGATVRCLQHGLSDENRSAEMTFFEGLSLLSGYYADAAVEHGVVRNYVANLRAGDESGNEGVPGELDELITERLRARTIPTQLRTLSSVIAEEGLTRIDLLKINVEKSELDVLRGIAPEDWPKIRQLVVEVDRREDVAPIELLLARHGFQSLVEQDPLLRETELCYIYAIRPSAARPQLAAQRAALAHVRPLPPVPEDILTPASLHGYLKERLPPYMIPSAFTLLDKLPLTSNGKIDRQALPLAAAGSRRAAAGLAMPKSETERKIAAIWAGLLKVERVGVDDDFFELGGQSLMAIRVVSRIRETFAVNLPLRNLFDHPTVAGLAEVVDRLAWLAGSTEHGVGDREEIEL